MNLALPSLRAQTALDWLPRVAGVGLFVALCALATSWALEFSAMRTIPLPKSARIAQTEVADTGAAATLFGGSAQSGVRDVQLLGVVADIGNGTGAAVLSLDGGPPKAVRVGADLSPQIRLAEIRGRAIVIERNGVRQEIALPMPATPLSVRGAGPSAVPAAPPAGAAAPVSTTAPPPVQQPQPVQPAPAPAQPAQPMMPAPAVQAGGNPGEPMPPGMPAQLMERKE